MEEVISQEAPDEQALRERLQASRDQLDALARDLRAADAELEGLADERRQHAVLEHACGALEELKALGAGRLFWGEQGEGSAEEHLRRARSHVDTFQRRVEEIDQKRREVVRAIERHEIDAEVLADEIHEIRLREESRKLEWIVEREMAPLPERPSVMPWSRGGEDDQRFRKSLAVSLAIGLLLGLLLPWIELPLPERWEPVEVPERLAQLIREERPLPPPPPVRQEATPEEVEPKVADEVIPKQDPKKEAESKGILAFREKFSQLAKHESSARLGSQARISSVAEAASGRPTRSMVATQAPGSSGGINLAALSRDVGGGGGDIEGVQVVRATSTIGGGGVSDRPLSDGPSLGRTDEEIQIVFDRHKAALYRLYNRELRRDPTLQGQMVLRLRIEPDGSVSLCELHGSDMNAPQLSAQVVGRVKTFDFGAKEGVPAITILYPIDFLPAS